MLRVDSDIVSRVFADIDAKYWKLEKMTTMQGKIHKYLWMTINYPLSGKLIFFMVNHIVKIIDNIP